MAAHRDDDVTPTDRPIRRSTGSVTSWGIIETWLETDHGRTITHSSESTLGHVVMLRLSNGKMTKIAVRPNEDPSAAVLRGISELA